MMNRKYVYENGYLSNLHVLFNLMHIILWIKHFILILKFAVVNKALESSNNLSTILVGEVAAIGTQALNFWHRAWLLEKWSGTVI